jgi:murein DD-endopeptidase MepM/ murein hydrolase activator NlpD
MADRVHGVHGTVRGQGRAGVGGRVLPVRRAQPVRSAGDGRAAVLVTPPGTPVHAVAAGTVADVDGDGGVAVTGEDRWRQHYSGLAPEAVTVAVGAAVPAGAVLGRVSDGGRLEVRLSDDAGAPVDAVEALIGLPDPPELGSLDPGPAPAPAPAPVPALEEVVTPPEPEVAVLRSPPVEPEVAPAPDVHEALGPEPETPRAAPVPRVHGAVRGQVWVGIGRRFLPVPRAQLVRGAGDGRAAVLPAPPGTPVHAVGAGTVADVDGDGALAVIGGDRWRQHYSGLAPEAVTVSVGVPVRAGAILGRVSAGGRLEVRLSDDAGAPVDAVEALIGLPDPSELGLRDPEPVPAPAAPEVVVAPVAPERAGASEVLEPSGPPEPEDLGIDPDELDRELVPADPFGGSRP